jgi:hypothetical protein
MYAILDLAVIFNSVGPQSAFMTYFLSNSFPVYGIVECKNK